jgi:hypothetical protein
MMMIVGAELGLLLYGIFVLIKGQYSMGKGRKVTGRQARLLGGICLVPMPLSLIAGFVIGFVNEAISASLTASQIKSLTIGIEVAILIAVVIVLTYFAKSFFKQQQAAIAKAL